MKFFDNGRNEFYPLDAIESMRKSYKLRGSDQHVPAKIYLKSNPEHGIETEDYTIDQILRVGASVVPADPGMRLLTFVYHPGSDDPGPWVHDEPILAWRVGHHGGIDPVVIDIHFEGMDAYHAIRDATGQVYNFEANYSSQEAWEMDMRNSADREHARKLAESA